MSPHISRWVVLALAASAACPARAGAQPPAEKAKLRHSDHVTCVTFSPDGTVLASAGGTYNSGEVILWDAAREKELGSLKGFGSSVQSVAFSPDGKLLATAGRNPKADRGEVKVWEVATRREVATIEAGETDIRAVAFSPDGQALVYAGGGRSDELVTWDLAKKQARMPFLGHKGTVTSVGWSADGKVLVSSGADGTVRVWNAASGKELRSLLQTDLSGVAVAADGRTAAATASGRREFGMTKVFDLTTGKELHILRGHSSGVSAAAFTPDGKVLFTAGGDKNIIAWDVTTGKIVATLQGHEGHVQSVAYSPKTKLLASGSFDKTVRIWDVVKWVGDPK
ncbi:MAG: hypothetical protein C0501_26935 [Isosphaera sp.]|nr:hypothetical protein [Isosphaera sp.]